MQGRGWDYEVDRVSLSCGVAHPSSQRPHHPQPFPLPPIFTKPLCFANWQLKNSCSWAALLHTSISKWYPDFGPPSLNPVCLWDFAHNLWLGHSFLWKALGTIFQRAPHLIFRWKFWTSYCESNLKAGLLAKQSVLPEASHMVCSILGGGVLCSWG